MAAFSTIAAGAGLALSGASTIKNIADSKQYKDELHNLEVPELTNDFENIQLPTYGTDRAIENTNVTIANMSDIARSGGARTAMGAIPQLLGYSRDVFGDIKERTDEQMLDREYAIAGGESENKKIRENRYLGEIQGYGQAIASSQQNIWNGLSEMLGAASMMGGDGDDKSNTSRLANKANRQAARAARRAARRG